MSMPSLQKMQWLPEVNASNDHVYAVLEMKTSNGHQRLILAMAHLCCVGKRRHSILKRRSCRKHTEEPTTHCNTSHLHTPEAGTPVNQLYAQVDKKKKKGDVREFSSRELKLYNL